MNKKEFISRWSELSGVSNSKLEDVFKHFTYALGDVLVCGDKITLPGLGTFSVKERPERVARNPLTGSSVKVAAKNVVKFKVGKQLEEKLNQATTTPKTKAKTEKKKSTKK